MSKKIKSVILSLMMAVSAFSGVGCLAESDQTIDTDKTQIYVSVYNGGVGVEWIKEFASEWNKSNNEYQIMIQEGKITTKDILQTIDAETSSATTPSCYFTAEPGYQYLIYRDKLEDLSDLVARKVDGESGGTIKDKIGMTESYYESVWKPVASKNGEGIYMLPYCDNFGGLIFDYQTFLENGLLLYAEPTGDVTAALAAQGINYSVSDGKLILESYQGNDKFFNYKKGDTIMTCGKDGKYGTYDDGQPITMSEFNNMLVKIGANKKLSAFIWSGQFYGYVDMVFEAIMAHYSGLNEYSTYYSFNGNVTIDGVNTPITPDNGYKVYGIDGYKQALNFIQNYVNNNSYYDLKTEQTLSHTDTQGAFILGYKEKLKQNGKEPMMIVEGTWFENEAKSLLQTESLIRDGRGYGDRDYRFMMIPALDGAYGLDGHGNGSVLTVQNSGAIIIPKTGDKNKLNALKDFIAYTLTNENLAKFTLKTGIINAYDYSLTDEQLNSLTKFTRNIYNIYHDTENIGFARTHLLYAASPMRFATTGGFYNNKMMFASGASQFDGVIKALRTTGVTVDTLADTAKIYYKTSENPSGKSTVTWESLLNEARQQGFYKN